MELTLAARRRRGAWCIVLWRRFILVAKRSKHINNALQWNLPGGNIDKGESPERSALRELDEEAGIKAGQVRVLKKFRFQLGSKHIAWAFLMRVTGKKPKVKLNLQESSKFQWMPLGKLRKAVKNNPNGWHAPTVAILTDTNVLDTISGEIKGDKIRSGKAVKDAKKQARHQQREQIRKELESPPGTEEQEQPGAAPAKPARAKKPKLKPKAQRKQAKRQAKKQARKAAKIAKKHARKAKKLRQAA